MRTSKHTLGGGPAGSVTFLLFAIAALLCALPSARLEAALTPPSSMTVNDTLSSAVERGVELTRFDQQFALRPRFLQPVSALFQVRWKTDRRTPEQGADRLRQDGRWYAGGERAILKNYSFFTAAEGEHFDDRPVNGAAQAGHRSRELQPTNPALPEEVASLFSGSISSVRILRGGGGLHVQPTRHIDAMAGLGIVEDKRLGRIESGLGAWSGATLSDWESGGYLHNADIHFNRESPSRHENLDLNGQYGLYREFYPGNSNRAQVRGSLVQRDIYMDQSGTLSTREDRRLAIEDALTYRVSKGIDAQLSGDILHDVTEQSQVDEERSRLEENQGGLELKSTARRGRWAIQSDLGLRLITQTIREDVLRGSKTDLSITSSGPLTAKLRGAIRLGVSKYQLDTRNEQNFDDRDELRFVGEAALMRPINRSLHLQTDVNVRLDHLVYIFKQNSANNRWTRYLGLATTLRHEPSSAVRQQVRALISANYIDYDYELNPRQTRSNIFRRFLAADSLTWEVGRRVLTRSKLQVQLEEFGRLFWDSFEEERSDNTRSMSASLEIGYLVHKQMRVGIGGIWDSRKSLRYASTVDAASEVSQNYQSYGPVWFAERTAAQGLALQVRGRHLRQIRLNLEDRWLFTGEGVLSWVW